MKLFLISVLVLMLSGCTTAGAPAPGESTNKQTCEVGEVWVCKKPMAATKNDPATACMCQRKVEVGEY